MDWSTILKDKEISITDIPGFQIGHAQDEVGGTGCTVILNKSGAIAGVDVRGGGPATRETDLLHPVSKMETIHAVVLSGGSAYGLDAASGVMGFLEDQGVGYDVQIGVVPIVCGASLFDLMVGSPSARPDRSMGYRACEQAWMNAECLQGNVGAGMGATVGKYMGPQRMMKSGFGYYAVKLQDVYCGAAVAVNALGDVFDVDTGKQIAGLTNAACTQLASTEAEFAASIAKPRDVFQGNTTIGCLLTNAKLTKPQMNKLASLCHNGLAQTIRPVHTSADGDSIFALSSNEVEVNADALGALSTYVTAKAINQAVYHAKSAFALKCAADFNAV